MEAVVTASVVVVTPGAVQKVVAYVAMPKTLPRPSLTQSRGGHARRDAGGGVKGAVIVTHAVVQTAEDTHTHTHLRTRARGP